MLQGYIVRNRPGLASSLSLLLVLVAVSASAQSQDGAPDCRPVVVGLLLPLTRDFASDKQGYQRWANMRKSVGRLPGWRGWLLILDDGSDPEQIAKDSETLIVEDHVDLSFGSCSTFVTRAPAPVALRQGSGTAPSVFPPDCSNLFDGLRPVASTLVPFPCSGLSLPPERCPHTAASMTSAGPFTFSQMELAMKLLAGGEIAIVSLMMGGESNQFAAGDLRALSADVVLPGAVIGELEKFYSRPMALIATAGADHGQDVVSAAGGLSYAGERGVPPGWHPQARTFQINASAAEAFSLGQALAQATLAPGGLNNVHLVATLPAGIVCNMVQGAAQCASSSATDAGPDRRTIQWQSGQLVPLSPYSVAAQNPAYPQATNF